MARASWPVVDPSLLVTEAVTCVVQVRGKVRARLEVAPDITEDELRELALAADGVVRSLAGREIAKVIIRAPKLVSIVPRESSLEPGASLRGRSRRESLLAALVATE